MLPEAENKVSNAEIIKKINMRFADINKINVEETGDGLKEWVTSFKEKDCISAQLIVSVGRKRMATLGIEKAKKLIKDIFRSKDVVTSAEVTYMRNEFSDIEHVDLIEERLFDSRQHTYISREEIKHEDVVEYMVTFYEQRRPDLNIYLPD